MTDFTSDAPPAGMKEPFTAADVAALFSVDPKTVTRWANQGRMGSFRTPGGHRRFTWAEIRKLGVQVPAGRTARGSTRAAVLTLGDGMAAGLYFTPVAAGDGPPGSAAVILGWTGMGKPVTLAAGSLEWLDDLEAAIQQARAQAIVAAELAATP